MRVLLIGGSGQLGTALERAFRSMDLVTTAHRHAARRHVSLDLADPSAIEGVLQHTRPDLVLVAGAMCHVDRCEQEPDLCSRINVGGPIAVAEFVRRSDARVVFFSTDHVFDGTEPTYREDDPVHPLNTYATSKAEAERSIREILPSRHLIVRTGWVYGPDPCRRNFVLRLVDRVRAGETVEVPDDQWGNPTHTEDLAAAVRFLVDRGETGTMHATGPDAIDRASFARRICDAFGLDRARVLARPTGVLAQPAPRALRVQLDCSRLRSTGAPAFRTIGDGLSDLARRDCAPVAETPQS
jgi:dTDP-4-dehydrorhamnose reductase